MGKLIFGIIGMICLEVLFVALIATELEREIAFMVPAPQKPVIFEAPPPQTPLSTVIEPLQTPEIATVKPAPRTRVTPQITKKRQPATSSFGQTVAKARKPERNAPPETFANTDFSPIIIRYRAAPAEPETAPLRREALVVQAEPYEEKRSLLAKTFSVLKKPWKWTRSLASKLR
jgi:hypothetical protein